MITVRKLNESLSDYNITVVAGNSGLDSKIEYLNVQEVQERSPWMKKNGLIMTTFNAFESIEQIVNHMKWYVEMGVSAVGFHSAIYREIPKELIEFSNKSNLPLLHIPYGTPYHLLFELYNSLIDEETIKMKEQIDKLNESMLEAVLLEKDTHFILQVMGKYLNAPIIYMDENMKIISIWSSKSSRSEIYKFIDDLKGKKANLFTKVRVENKKVNIDAAEFKSEGLKSLNIIPLTINLKCLGFLVVGVQDIKSIFHGAIIKNGVTALKLNAIKQNATKEYQKNEDIKLFEEIFADRRAQEISKQDFYYDISRIQAIVIAETKNNDQLKECYRRVYKLMEDADLNCLVWIFEKRIIAIIQKKVRILKGLNDGSIEVVMGISGEMKGCSKKSIKKLYDQAKIALHFAQKERKEGHCCTWNELGIEKIIYFMKQSELLSDFSWERLQPLIEYDQLNDTEFIKTLYIYLKHFFRLKESGEELHIHPNTVKYRINKIQEIMGIDFNNPEEYMNLMIALRSFLHDFDGCS
jgi:PucR family transcriptional regulator, purine catabolism regulatory protein